MLDIDNISFGSLNKYNLKKKKNFRRFCLSIYQNIKQYIFLNDILNKNLLE